LKTINQTIKTVGSQQEYPCTFWFLVSGPNLAILPYDISMLM